MNSDGSQGNHEFDIKILSSFIYELNITRRHILSYPPHHPIIIAASTKVLAILEELLEFHDRIILGIARNALMLGSGLLDRNNPVFRNFAEYKFSRGIATISFTRKMTAEDLNKFNTILNKSPDIIKESGGIVRMLAEAGIRTIEVQEIDYSAFRVTDEHEIKTPDNKKLVLGETPLWGRFIQGLMDGNLDPRGEGITSTGPIDPEELAAFMNNRAHQLVGSGSTNYDQAITSFMRQLDRDELASNYDADSLSKLGQFMKKLSPVLRNQFLQSSFDALPHHSDVTKKLISSFPDEIILDALDEVSASGAHLSQSVVTMLQLISKNGATSLNRKSKAAGSLSDVELNQKLRFIFQEDDPGRFLPEEYQRTLKAIDEYTFTHSTNVCILNLAQAMSLGIEGQMLQDIGIAAMLHDIGKLFIPEEILAKPDALNAQEWEQIKLHPARGAQHLLTTPGVPQIAILAAFEHHMNYDFTGYPTVERGWKQHLCSQMTTLSDIFDALRSKRSYRGSLEYQDISSMMLGLGGTRLNPLLLNNFLGILKKASRTLFPKNI